MKKIVIASKNPVKINATLQGFKRMFPQESFKIEGISVPSQVSDQPKTDEETFRGAYNRAENASQAAPLNDFWVGIEGGVEESSHGMGTLAWVVIKSKDNKFGRGRTGTFFLPPKVAELVKQGKELGEADDIVFSRVNSKQDNGSVGILTDNVMNRTDFYAGAVILALIPFKNTVLYS